MKKYVIHPDYNLTAKQEMGIQEYYEFDVALIQLEKPVDISSNLRWGAQIINMWCYFSKNTKKRRKKAELIKKHNVYFSTDRSASHAPKKPMQLWNFQKVKGRVENMVSPCQTCRMPLRIISDRMKPKLNDDILNMWHCFYAIKQT